MRLFGLCKITIPPVPIHIAVQLAQQRLKQYSNNIFRDEDEDDVDLQCPAAAAALVIVDCSLMSVFFVTADSCVQVGGLVTLTDLTFQHIDIYSIIINKIIYAFL